MDLLFIPRFPDQKLNKTSHLPPMSEILQSLSLLSILKMAATSALDRTQSENSNLPFHS